MNVSASSNASQPSLLLRLGENVSTTDQEQPRSESSNFRQTLLEVGAGLDLMELSNLPPSADPTRSSLFQSHLGTFGPGSARVATTLLPEEQSPLRVSGISATVAANSFAGDRSLASNPFQEPLLEPTSTQGVPVAAGSEDFSGIYDARTGQIIHRVGARFDVKG